MDEQRENAIYEEYQPKVYRFLYGKLGNKYDAEDLCANVFVKVLTHLDSFDPSRASVSTWIYNITRNTLYDYYRTHKVHGELDENLTDQSDFTEDLCDEETLEELAAALASLDENQRDVILFHYYQHLTLKEVAARMDFSYSYIKLLHNNAVQNLQRIMKRA